MLSDLTDKEQVELFKKWWRNYGKSISFAIVLGLLIGFGWRYWHQYRAHKAEQASIIYAQLQNAYAQNQTKAIQPLTTQLITDYRSTPYASLAAFLVARDAAAQKNYPMAVQQLTWVMQQAKLTSFRQIARLRAARILLAEKQPQAALVLLQKIEDPAYSALIDTLKGDVFTAMGNTPAAAKAYQNAKNELHQAGINNPFLQIKLSQ
jgi:predicted negative regulator of RcsB-dependent stress response